MFRTYKYRIYPTKTQIRRMEETLETCRRWYNDCLAERKEAWGQEKRSVTFFQQSKRLTESRKTNPYQQQASREVLEVATKDLDKSFRAFFRRVKSGETPGYPRFKGKNRFDSFGYLHWGKSRGVFNDGRRLRLPLIGRIAVRWDRALPENVRCVRIIHKNGKWYASFGCEVEENHLPAIEQVVGVDLGIEKLATYSTGEQVPNPQWYRDGQKRLRVLQRRMSRRAKKDSAGRIASIPQTKGYYRARKAVALHHEYVANRRIDYLRKVIKNIVERFDFIAVEDLSIRNMVKNKHLSKSILDGGWGYFRLQLLAKAEEAGRKVVVVNPAYTSKTCSGCGTVHDLSLADRWLKCECGLSLDRDHNAAINILAKARDGENWVGHTQGAQTKSNRASVAPKAAVRRAVQCNDSKVVALFKQSAICEKPVDDAVISLPAYRTQSRGKRLSRKHRGVLPLPLEFDDSVAVDSA